MRQLAFRLFAVTVSCIGLQASIWFELTPAGRLPGTAQATTGIGSLTGILGTLDEQTEADLFRIRITDPLAFSAFTIDDPGFRVPDPKLFLFDEFGRGIYTNDDANGSQSELPAGDMFGPLTPGIYLLGIARFDNTPLSAGGPIFTADAGVNGPDFSAGGSSPLTGWDDNVIGRIDFETEYLIGLTGAEFEAIPEPATLGMAAAGLLLTWIGRSRISRK